MATMERHVIREWTTGKGKDTWRAVRVADGTSETVVIEWLGTDAAGDQRWEGGVGDGWERRACHGLLLRLYHEDHRDAE